MDTKSKILFSIFGSLIILSILASYYRFMVLHNYVVQTEVNCDPTRESCFTWQCDPTVEEECTGNQEEDMWYFKIAHRNAKNISECDMNDEECLPFVCPEGGEVECDEILCTDDSLIEYNISGECTNPNQFQFDTVEDEDTDTLE